jgi:dihydrofolate reductase
MLISLIVAKSKNNVIGKNNQLPWRLPADLKHFKNITMGKPIIMGRKTFESIGKPLPGRRNIIITHNKNYVAQGCDVFHSIDDALNALKNEVEVMIIGGANLYAQTMECASRLYLTEIDIEIDGDAFFPRLDLTKWQLVSEQKCAIDQKNQYAYCFQVWEK